MPFGYSFTDGNFDPHIIFGQDIPPDLKFRNQYGMEFDDPIEADQCANVIADVEYKEIINDKSRENQTNDR